MLSFPKRGQMLSTKAKPSRGHIKRRRDDRIDNETAWAPSGIGRRVGIPSSVVLC